MREQQGVSLHIGVNQLDADHYDGWLGKLTFAEKDCDDTCAIAQSAGFETKILKTQQATREAVTSSIREIAKELDDGDFFLLSYSGHGGTVVDVDFDELDGVDETWCLFDGELLDDELSILWAGFKPGVRLLVLSDSCHSGTLLKSIDPGLKSSDAGISLAGVHDIPKAMPRDVAKQTMRNNLDFYKDIQHNLPNPRPEIRATVRLLSGCMEDEQSFENTLKENGRFTDAIKAIYADGSFKGDYEQFHHEIKERVKHKQTPVHSVSGTPNVVYDKEPPFKI